VCSALCTDPESDPDCPRGCGPGDSCVHGPTCPAPDPDCGDPCGDQGHCIETCATRDPDCPAPKPTGATCARTFECAADALCYEEVCTETCDVAASSCGDGATCTQVTPEVAVCIDGDDGGGCSVCNVGARDGRGAAWWLAGVAALMALRRRRRPRR
jgi:MYXO-CTERM domain-containing protein